ncbi:hypothetical protein BUALT_Bualt06G0146600 [Buddleja alternifolia]|uniref:Carbohydrate kinase PfkB domain-containing protein n=1 Tax=Buddleja alternifolia TaxID=168488 RepID=A0AAV6XN67_9LAMI|nr:hypothetical protein BUALT_Bualt06G0146600 [Buddleja alternifolia]
MSFSLISLSSTSSISIPQRKFPSQFHSQSSATLNTYYYASTNLNSSLFNSTTIRPISLLPVNSYSCFSSMSNATNASSTDDSAEICTSTSSATDELGESDSDDDDANQEQETEEDAQSPAALPERWHVLGLGQAMVDFSGMVDDEFLDTLGLEKGTRKVVNHEERGRVLRAMDGCSYKAAAGGSLSNSLVALARLGGQPIGGHSLNVAMAGSVGSDPLGGFYRSKLRRADVNFLSAPVKDGTTGTVIVLTTSDAQRTMLAYQTIAMACEDARRCGALVAITASDVTCIERHYDDFWDIMANYADIILQTVMKPEPFVIFTKESLLRPQGTEPFVPFVSVTDGPKGSYIGVKGEAVTSLPSPCVPADTCGAGDAYASGYIVWYIVESDLKGLGSIAAKVASVVVAQKGTR